MMPKTKFSRISKEYDERREIFFLFFFVVDVVFFILTIFIFMRIFQEEEFQIEELIFLFLF